MHTLEHAAQRGGRRQIVREGNKTNQAVVWHWMNGKPFKSLRMSTDGRELFSYNLCIRDTVRETDEKVLKDYTAKGRYGYSSQTTSTHVNIARDERFMSGIDTRGASANCFLKGVGGGTACQILVWAECTSSLKIMANKVLEIVQ